MLAALLAVTLGGSGMLEVSTVCSKGYERTRQSPECTTLLDAYEKVLAAALSGKAPESMRLDEVKQDFIPGRLLLASGWTDGGHRQLERVVFRVPADGALQVVWLQPTPLSDDGERQQLSDVSVAPLAAYLDLLKSRGDVSGFQARFDRFQKSLTSVRRELLAALKAAPSAQRFTSLTALLLTLLEKAVPRKVLSSVEDMPSKLVRELFAGKASPHAAWVGAPVTFEAFTTSVAAGTAHGLAWGGEDDNQLFRVALSVTAGGFTFERQFVAFERRYVE